MVSSYYVLLDVQSGKFVADSGTHTRKIEVARMFNHYEVNDRVPPQGFEFVEFTESELGDVIRERLKAIDAEVDKLRRRRAIVHGLLLMVEG